MGGKVQKNPKNLLKAKSDKVVRNCQNKFWGNAWPQRSIWNIGSPKLLCPDGICQIKQNKSHTHSSKGLMGLGIEVKADFPGCGVLLRPLTATLGV